MEGESDDGYHGELRSIMLNGDKDGSAGPSTRKEADASDIISRLPGEIRNKIYSYLLVQEAPIAIHPSGKRMVHFDPEGKPGSNKWAKSQPKSDPKDWSRKRRKLWILLKHSMNIDVLRANKLIAHETASIFYGSNTFEFKHTAALYNFLAETPKMRQHLQNVVIPWPNAWTDGRFVSLLSAENMRSITIESETIIVRALTGEGWVNIKDLAAALLPFLRQWQAVHDPESWSKSVLDIVTFAQFKRSGCCGYKVGHRQHDTPCAGAGTHKREHPEHHLKEVSTEFRRIIAAELGLSE